MSSPNKAISFSVPKLALQRLLWYISYAQLVKKERKEHISSTEIAKNIGIDSSKVAKDLSYVHLSGKTRVGYNIDELIYTLEQFLEFTSSHKAFIFGVENLGGALLQDNGLSQYGLEIVAGLDIKYELAGTRINHIPIHHMSRFEELREKTGTNIGILTAPIQKAQEVCDIMVKGGIKAIWNFTPYRIKVPKNTVIQNTSIYAHLAVMFNRLKTINEIENHHKDSK